MILSSLLPARLLRLLPRRVSRSLLNKSATGPHARTPSPRKAFRQSGRLFCHCPPQNQWRDRGSQVNILRVSGFLRVPSCASWSSPFSTPQKDTRVHERSMLALKTVSSLPL